MITRNLKLWEAKPPPPADLCSESYLNPPHVKFLNTPGHEEYHRNNDTGLGAWIVDYTYKTIKQVTTRLYTIKTNNTNNSFIVTCVLISIYSLFIQ